MRDVGVMWAKIAGTTLAVMVVLNLAVTIGQGVGIPLTDVLVFGTEKPLWLLLQFLIALAVGTAVPLLWPLFAWVLLYAEARPISDLLLNLLSRKAGAFAYILTTPAIFPMAADGLLVQLFGLLMGIMICKRFFPGWYNKVRRVVP